MPKNNYPTYKPKYIEGTSKDNRCKRSTKVHRSNCPKCGETNCLKEVKINDMVRADCTNCGAVGKEINDHRLITDIDVVCTLSYVEGDDSDFDTEEEEDDENDEDDEDDQD